MPDTKTTSTLSKGWLEKSIGSKVFFLMDGGWGKVNYRNISPCTALGMCNTKCLKFYNFCQSKIGANYIIAMLYFSVVWDFKYKINPARARARRACALRALGLLLVDGVLTVGWGKTFWRIGRVPTQKRA